MSYDKNNELLNIKTQIESMNKFHQIEILKIFKKNNVILNENKNGIFINLSEISGNNLDDLNEYINYVNIQENQLSHHENKKEKFKNDFYSGEQENIIFKKHKVKKESVSKNVKNEESNNV
jgi:hypothetical protein